MKVGVIAGTQTDTQMAVDILTKQGAYDTIFLPVSKDCNEQNAMQYFSKEELYKVFVDTCKIALEKNAECIFLYCNSLSASVDYKRAEKELNVKIITPLESYIHLPEACKSIVILAANGLSAFNIEKIIKENNPKVHTLTIGNLGLVDAIEKNLSPTEIMSSLNISGFINYLEHIKNDDYKVDTLILGCTHFPYIKEEIKKNSNLTIIDPVEDMLEKLKEHFT